MVLMASKRAPETAESIADHWILTYYHTVFWTEFALHGSLTDKQLMMAEGEPCSEHETIC